MTRLKQSTLSPQTLTKQSSVGYGSACAKVILLGEHAVVYGHPALAIPLKELRITCRLSRQQQNQPTISCPLFEGELQAAPPALDGIRRALKGACLSLHTSLLGIHIDFLSSIPLSRGLGSSAAAAIAAIRACYQWQQTPLSAQKLNQLATISEQIYHGSPSGLDATTIIHETAILYQKPTFQHLSSSLSAALVIADTGTASQTKQAVAHVKQRLRVEPLVKHHLDHLGLLAHQAYRAYRNGQAKQLGRHMTMSHQLLEKIGVSNHQLNQLVQAALQNGALGAKLTGSGQGGCMIALAKTPIQARRIANALEQAGAKATWISAIS